MAAGIDAELGLFDEDGFLGVHCACHLRFCDEKVQLREHLEICRDLPRLRSGHSREFLQNAGDFALLFEAQRPNAIVCIECRDRLDEQRMAARTGIVDDSGNFAAEFSLDRHDEAPVADRYDGILDRICVL